MNTVGLLTSVTAASLPPIPLWPGTGIPEQDQGSGKMCPFQERKINHVKFPFFRPVQIELMKETFLGH